MPPPQWLRAAERLAMSDFLIAAVAIGEFEAARELSQDTLARARCVFGDNHPRTQKATDNLAAALHLLRESAYRDDSDPVDGS
ncbi:MAG: hypothetical protein ACT4NY_22340 [Pseudonocardiales bacterium]